MGDDDEDFNDDDAELKRFFWSKARSKEKLKKMTKKISLIWLNK